MFAFYIIGMKTIPPENDKTTDFIILESAIVSKDVE